MVLQIAQGYARTARNVLLEEGFVSPAAFIFTPRGLHVVGCDSFRDEEDEGIFLAEVKRSAHKEEAHLVVVVNESYFHEVSKTDHTMETQDAIIVDAKSSRGVHITLVQPFSKADGAIEFGKPLVFNPPSFLTPLTGLWEAVQ